MPLFVEQSASFPSDYAVPHLPPPTPSPSVRAPHRPQPTPKTIRRRNSMTCHFAHVILPFVFAILFAITGAVVLTYSLDHRGAIPPKIVTGLAVSFGTVISAWLCCLFCLYIRTRWNEGDIEAGYSAKSSASGTERGFGYRSRCKRGWKGCLWFFGREEEDATVNRSERQFRFIDVFLGTWNLAKGWKSRRRARKNLEDRAASDDSLTKDLGRNRRQSESLPSDPVKVLRYVPQGMNTHPTHQRRLRVVNRSNSQDSLRQIQGRRSPSSTSELEAREVLSLSSNLRRNVDISVENSRNHIRRHTSPPIPSSPDYSFSHPRPVQVPGSSQIPVHMAHEASRNISLNNSEQTRVAKDHNPVAQSLRTTETVDQVAKVRELVDNSKSKYLTRISPKPAASTTVYQVCKQSRRNLSQQPTYRPYNPQERDMKAVVTSCTARQPHLNALKSSQAFPERLTFKLKV